MTEQTTSHYAAVEEDAPSSWAIGFTAFAGVIMIMAGGFQSLSGIAALAKDDFYVATPNYVLELDATQWGWTHLLLGLLVLFAGFAVLSGQTWGRVIGIILAVLSALVNFAFIPVYPFWSITIIALDVFIIWALAAHGRDIAR
jgi:hypothetical protein